MVATDRHRSTGTAVALRVRWVAVRGLASALAGFLVLGFGGRLVMFGSRLLHPDALGRITENGNRIGEFTLGGSVALILFGGLLSGLIAGVVWALVKEWMSGRPWVVGLGAVAIGGPLLVRSDNPDFVILSGPGLDVFLLVALVFLFGAALAWIDDLFDHRLPSGTGTGSVVGYTLVLGIGAPLAIPAFGSYLSREFCFCERPPILTGGFLLAVAATTVTWWALDLRGVRQPSAPVRRLGRVFTAGAASAGAIHLTGEIVRIL